MGLKDADTAENNSGSRHIVITPVLCAVPDRAEGDPKLVGPIAGIRIEPGTILRSLYGEDETIEEHFCNYEVNPEYLDRFRASGLRLTAWGPQGELKAIELPTHVFFVAMLYQPQRARKQPHPVALGFLRAAADFSAQRGAQRGGDLAFPTPQICDL